VGGICAGAVDFFMKMINLIQLIFQKLNKNSPIAPLISFRILFGLLCFFGLLWSAVKGEIQGRYWDTDFHFKYWGFEWLPYPGDAGIILLYVLAALGALGIAFGALYKVSVSVFALSFSYLHTVDSSNFINHYYLIWIFTLVSFIFCSCKCQRFHWT
jgi:hypothetical protein